MALFYFHRTNGRTVVLDRIGVHLLHLEAAKGSARAMFARYAVETVADGQPFPGQTTIEVCDADDRVVHLEWGWCLLRDPTPLPSGETAAS